MLSPFRTGFMYSQCVRRTFKVEKLSDEFGRYTILLRCDCGHQHRCYPRTLAAISGWDARLIITRRRSWRNLRPVSSRSFTTRSI